MSNKESLWQHLRYRERLFKYFLIATSWLVFRYSLAQSMNNFNYRTQ